MKNPVKDLPYTEGALDTYAKYGYMIFPQQRKIYDNIANRLLPHSTVLEVGCGIGLGTAILSRSLTTEAIGTDNLIENVKIAKALYPWIRFEQWNVCTASSFQRVDAVVAVEVLEHVANPVAALTNMCAITNEVWLSTPNGTGKKRPPDNPYHVVEYTPQEIIYYMKKIEGDWSVEVLEYENFTPVALATKVDPLVYHLTRGKR